MVTQEHTFTFEISKVVFFFFFSPGVSVSTKNWPALITITQGEEDGSQSVSVSWFFPPGTELPTPQDTSMSKEVRPAGLVYVRYISRTHLSYVMLL